MSALCFNGSKRSSLVENLFKFSMVMRLSFIVVDVQESPKPGG